MHISNMDDIPSVLHGGAIFVLTFMSVTTEIFVLETSYTYESIYYALILSYYSISSSSVCFFLQYLPHKFRFDGPIYLKLT